MSTPTHRVEFVTAQLPGLVNTDTAADIARLTKALFDDFETAENEAMTESGRRRGMLADLAEVLRGVKEGSRLLEPLSAPTLEGGAFHIVGEAYDLRDCLSLTGMDLTTDGMSRKLLIEPPFLQRLQSPNLVDYKLVVPLDEVHAVLTVTPQ